MTHPIHQLRLSTLDPKLQAQLAPFINAHRPFDGVELTRKEHKADGFQPYEPVTTGLEDITEDNSLLTTYFYCPTTGNFYPRPDINSDWLTAKVNHWKAQTANKRPTQ